jgi:hypothetical protein
MGEEKLGLVDSAIWEIGYPQEWKIYVVGSGKIMLTVTPNDEDDGVQVAYSVILDTSKIRELGQMLLEIADNHKAYWDDVTRKAEAR